MTFRMQSSQQSPYGGLFQANSELLVDLHFI